MATWVSDGEVTFPPPLGAFVTFRGPVAGEVWEVGEFVRPRYAAWYDYVSAARFKDGRTVAVRMTTGGRWVDTQAGTDFEVIALEYSPFRDGVDDDGDDE